MDAAISYGGLGAIVMLLDSLAFVRVAPGTSWETNITVHGALPKVQATLNYAWTNHSQPVGMVEISAEANQTHPDASGTKDTALSSPPTDASVSLTLVLYYTQLPRYKLISYGGGEGNVQSYLRTLAWLNDTISVYPAKFSSAFPPILLSLSLAVMMAIPLILSSRRRVDGV